MNRGIVVGKVYTKDGYPSKDAKVKVHYVEGGARKLEIEKYEVKTNRKGEFSAPFLWKGSGIADDLSGSISIRLVAWTEVGDIVRDGYSADTSFTARTIRGYLAEDILRPINTATGNPFNSPEDFGDFVISIGQALANYKNLVPFWKVSQTFSTEGKVIGAGVELWLDNTN